MNLANKDFEGIYFDWYRGQTPKPLQVDIVLAFQEDERVHGDAVIVGVEVKYFRYFENRGFYEGLGQILSYSIFGFDGLSLWHLFSKELEDGDIQRFGSATKEVVERLGLPIFYLCGKIVDEEELKINIFEPIYLEGKVSSLSELTYNNICKVISGRSLRNPLLFSDTIIKRRKTLKAMLKIPV